MPDPDFSQGRQPIRCAQVIGTFGGGGAQRLAINLAGGIARLGHSSWAIALRDEGGFASSADAGVRLVALGARKGRPVSIAMALVRLRRLCVQESIELVHVHGASTLPLVTMVIAGLRRPPALVFTWHDSESVLESGGLRSGIIRRNLKWCRHVSGSSRSVAARLEVQARIRGVGVFHGGVPETPAPATRAGRTPMIIWVGRLVPSKDAQILLRAASALRAEGLAFTVCILGGPIESTRWYWEETKQAVDRLGLSDIVSMPGFVGGEALRSALESASIAVQTSHTEGLSLALLECMMAGLPVIATDVGDTAIALRTHREGVLIEPRNEAQLVDALRGLIIDERLRLALGGAARQRAMDEFSTDSMARRAVECYCRVLGRSALPGADRRAANGSCTGN